MSEDPQPLQIAPPVLKGLSARRARWRAEREARLSLFGRPTPAADRLLVVARVRTGARRMTWAIGLMLGAHLLWRLSGLELSHPGYIWLDGLLGPALQLLRVVAPEHPPSDASDLILQHVELLLCVVGLELAAVWALRAWLYPALLPLAAAARAQTLAEELDPAEDPLPSEPSAPSDPPESARRARRRGRARD